MTEPELQQAAGDAAEWAALEKVFAGGMSAEEADAIDAVRAIFLPSRGKKDR